MRILALKTRLHIPNTQGTRTRTQTLFDSVNNRLSQAVSTYQTSREAIASLDPNEEFDRWKEILLELRNEDVHGPGVEKHKPGAPRPTQSWIWTTAPSHSTSEDPDLQATLQVEWAKAQEQASRYEEEVELIVEEMRRTLVSFEWNAREWDSFATSTPFGDSAIDATTIAGIVAYAKKQADIRRRMAKIFLDDWYSLLKRLPLDLEHLALNIEWLEEYPRPVGVKRRRLVSNVKLYHPDHYDPEIDLSGADEIVSDHEDGNSDSLSAVDDDFEELTDCYS